MVHVAEPVFTAEQGSAVRSNTTINELHSLLEQAPEQSRGIDEVLVASGAGRDRLSGRSAHVPSPAANDIGWLPTASFYYYYPPTTSTDTPSAARGRSELSNQGHLSIAAASRQNLAGPPRHRESSPSFFLIIHPLPSHFCRRRLPSRLTQRLIACGYTMVAGHWILPNASHKTPLSAGNL